MATQVSPLGLRLFLEGIEVPVIAGQVMIQPDQPATAAIQIVPTDTGLLFLPRTLVHLFYLDTDLTLADQALSDQILAQQALNNTTPRTSIDRFDVQDDRYKLLFSGEVIGYNFNKTPSSRALVLQCMDLSSYWDTCYQWFADFSVGGSGLTDKTHNFVGGGEGLFNNVASGTRWVIQNILLSKPENPEYADTEGLLAGYIHLLESIGGLRPKSQSYAGFRGVNDFFTIAELRYNLTGMIGAVAKDKSSAQMFAAKAFIDWLQQGMASAGSLISYRDVLRLVGQYIYHSVYPNPAAYYVKGGAKIQQQQTNVYTESLVGKDITKAINDAASNLVGLRSALNNLTALGDGFGTISFFNGRDGLKTAVDNINKAYSLINSGGSTDAGRVGAQLLDINSSLEQIRVEFNTSASSDNSQKQDKIAFSQAASIADELNSPIALLDAITKTTVTKRTTKNVQVATSDHLYNQLLLPEAYFVVPPRCNVLFPDQYTQFNFNRNYLREVTRLSVQAGLGLITGSARGDNILGSYYFAPNIRDAKGKIAKTTIFSQGSTLLPHEVHSGIVPKFEWVSDGQRYVVKAAVNQKKTTENQKGSYLARVANFQFFLHRFGARQMSCTMRFNPYLVIGFPCVILDRSAPSPAAIELISSALGTGRQVLPTAYIGKLVNLVHDVNQAGGQTQAAFSQARTHRGIDDEFLGVLMRERKDLVEDTHNVDAFEVTDASQNADPVDRELLLRYVLGTLAVGTEIDGGTVTAVGTSTDTAQLGLGPATILGLDPDQFQAIFDQQGAGQPTATAQSLFAITVPSLLTVTVEKKTDLGKFVSPEGAPPPEVLLQPGWYSDVWSPANISANVYGPLLGCSSVIDDQVVGDKDGFVGLVGQFFAETGMADVPVNTTVDNSGATIVQVAGKTIAAFDVATGTLEQAIDGLTMLYGILKRKDLDVKQFINDYTRRPIATLPQILGSSNLQFDASGNVVDPTTMIEGFHSRAFGDYNTDVQPVSSDGTQDPVPGANALFGLIPSDKAAGFNRTIVNKAKVLSSVPPYLDPRGSARQRVKAYAAELGLSRGLMAS